MRYLSVCSGMEAASVAWEPLGWKAVGFSEIEPFPCAILKHRFPNTPNYGSLTEYQSWPIEPGAADLLVGGTPCQSFSVAGLRKGMADPRGNLALTFLGLADRIKPRWIVWENVPGVLSSNGGRDFGAFLGALVELGYGFAYRVLDAQYFGVPQRRRRVFVVACLGDWRAAASVLFEPDCVRRHLEAGGKKRKGRAADAGSGVDPRGCVEAGGQHAFGTKSNPEVANTLETTCHDYSRADGFTTIIHPVVIDRAAFNQVENAQYEPHIGESEVMDSLVARGPHAVGVPNPIVMRESGHGFWMEDEKAGTLRAEGENRPSRPSHVIGQPVATSPVVEPVDPKIVQASELRLRGQITEQSICPTLTAGAKQGDTEPLAVHPVCSDVAGTLTVGHHSCAGHQHRMGDHSFLVAHPPMAVRRLSPVEAERLQGFPDNWSRISWKGKPEEDCPDGPRYKACGNSMAVPVMRWIGERIAQADQTFFPR
jgi:DNA (cytosine-5)-methyltransferase 1